MSQKRLSGSLNLILGPMYSGKTSTLITRYNRHIIARRKCLMVKYKNDTRYDDKMIVTHNGIKIDAIACDELADIDNIVKNFDVVCIDEIQFYKDAYIFCDKWANEGLIVEACGLNGTFERKPFHVVSLLIPQCNHLEYITAICRETGNDANYSKRNTDDKEEEIIGGADIYSAADRKTFFGPSDNWYKDNFVEYAKCFCEKRSIELSDKLINIIRNIKIDENTNYKKLIHKLTSDSLKYSNLKNKRVILLMDFDNIDNKFKTIKFIINKNPEKLIIMGHLTNKNNTFHTTESIRNYISSMLGLNIKLWKDINETIPETQIVMLNDLQNNKNELMFDEQFSNQLTKLCDVYINDAFNISNNKYTSIIGINAPEKYQGLSFKNEMKYLHNIFNKHERKIAIIADSQINRDLFMNMIDNVNSIIIGGKISVSFMKCLYDVTIGNTVCDNNDLKYIPEIIEKSKLNKVSIYLPLDFVCIDIYNNQLVTYPDKPGIPNGCVAIDVGQDTIDYYTAIISDANSVIWTGIFGSVENNYNGTKFLMNNLADMLMTKVLIGDDLVKECQKLKLVDRFDHLSTSNNGVSILEGKTLPGIEFLKQR